MPNYMKLKENITGWNTYNTRSVLSHVLMPYGFSVNIGIKEYENGRILNEALIGRFGKYDEVIMPGYHAYDGSYTELMLKWCKMELSIKTAVENEDLVILIEPVKNKLMPPTVYIQTGFLWQKEGVIKKHSDCILAEVDEKKIYVYATEDEIYEPNLPVFNNSMVFNLDGCIGISTGKTRSLDKIKEIIDKSKEKHVQQMGKYGECAELYNAMQACMAWDSIYEPTKGSVITPVSRIWNVGAGGYILFCWDTFFGALMAAKGNKFLAYSNTIEILTTMTKDGFVPNFEAGKRVSLDRSQPPVGSFVVREIYRQYNEKWFIEKVFDRLFKWNTWFFNNRRINENLMGWGSNPRIPVTGNEWEYRGINDTFGGALESGLDNSPMYDDAGFDKEKHIMKLADIGLMGLYIMDCKALIDIANEISKYDEKKILQDRKKIMEDGIDSLWCDDFGLHLNKHTDTNKFSYRISPTNFYALFSDSLTEKQKEDIINKHFYNPDEFRGEYMMASIAKNDSAFKEQNYCRGRKYCIL